MIFHKNSSQGIQDMDRGKSTIVGYASKFGNVDDHGDIVQSGAFKRTLDHGPSRVKSLMHHNPLMIVGRPLVMREDSSGLYTETKVSDTALGRDLLTLIEDGVIDEMSIGFIPVRKSYDKETKATLLHEVKLIEYSFVTLASNPEARVQGLKSSAALGDVLDSMRRMEKSLRDGSFETDNVPEALEFALKYWRSALEASVVVENENVVSLSEDDSPHGTHQAIDDSALATRAIADMLVGWRRQYEVSRAIEEIGKTLEVS
jgi:uncharacterized protein